MNPGFWRGKKVFLTGHTGFKGGWLSLWLSRLGAEVSGYALPPPTVPNLFAAARIGEGMRSTFGDIRDRAALRAAMADAAPEIVFHLAAQPLVRQSYADPVETYETNVMGTVHLLEAVRAQSSVRAAVVVSSDKCYENREWVWGYREDEPMGGFDPYSSSKGCTELATAAWRRSFFADGGAAIASARAGNVIGGGDWAPDRLLPDMVRAFGKGEAVRIRFPNATRPWQHVLEPLAGYLALARRLSEAGTAFAEGWNFGPREEETRPVEWIVREMAGLWGDGAAWSVDAAPQPHEAQHLRLDCAKARARLGWAPRLDLQRALAWTAEWYVAHRNGHDMRALCEAQIARYEDLHP